MAHTPSSVAAQAEDADQDPSTESSTEASTTNQQSPQQAEKKPAANSAKSAKDTEIFRPSEEISEDFAVSFPVDI